MARVLLVEPDPVLLGQYGRVLSNGHNVVGARSAQESIDALDDDTGVDLIVTECSLGVNNGFELVHEIRSHDDWIDVPIVLLSSMPPSRFPTKRLSAYGIVDFLYKPHTTPHQLAQRVGELVDS